MITSVTRIKLKRATDHARGNVQQFLERLLVEVVSENYRYFLTEHLYFGTDDKPSHQPEHRCSPPLLSNERQVSGLFATGLSRVSPVFRQEHPISRSNRTAADNDDRLSLAGRIDFLSYYGNRDIALELKRCPISTVGAPGFKKGLTAQWNAVSKQSKDALAYMRTMRNNYTSPVSVGLLVVRVGRKVTVRRDLEQARADAANALPGVAAAVNDLTRADYVSFYTAPREMQISSGWGESEDQYVVFPGVVFAAVVHESTKEASAKA